MTLDCTNDLDSDYWRRSGRGKLGEGHAEHGRYIAGTHLAGPSQVYVKKPLGDRAWARVQMVVNPSSLSK